MGNWYYKNVVEKWLRLLIGEHFAVPVPTIVRLIQEHAKEAGSFNADSRSAASFLVPRHFGTMYMGGMVLACAPLLDSMLGSTLLEGGAATKDSYTKNLEYAHDYFQCMVRQRVGLATNPGDTKMGSRLKQVQDHLDLMFGKEEEDRVMRNLITEVAKLFLSVLQPEERSLLHLFKARLRSQYWRAGRDPTMFSVTDVKGSSKPTKFADALDELMDVIHAKAAKTTQPILDENEEVVEYKRVIEHKRQAHSLLLCVDIFFSDEQSHDLETLSVASDDTNHKSKRISSEERAEKMRFLSKVFNFVHVLEGQAVPNEKKKSSVMAKIGKALSESGFKEEDIQILKSRIGCAYMALKMLPTTEAVVDDDDDEGEEDSESEAGEQGQLVRAIFVGAESAGKSSLINFLINPSGDKTKPLPVAKTQCTQCITIVKHSECDEMYLGDERVGGSDINLHKELEKEKDKEAKKKNRKNISLETPLSTVKSPFQAELRTMNFELVDVPGIRRDTQLDTAFALGVCTCMVICCSDSESLEEDLSQGENLPKLKRCYENLVSPPPILLAVTRPDIMHSYDRSSFRLTN
jgi:GTPase SAR1 family protein